VQHVLARHVAERPVLGQIGSVEGSQRLGADHVLASGGSQHRHRTMQMIRHTQIHDVDV